MNDSGVPDLPYDPEQLLTEEEIDRLNKDLARIARIRRRAESENASTPLY